MADEKQLKLLLNGVAESWIDPYGSPENNRMVGQIYFPLDGDILDEDDITQLDALIDLYIIYVLWMGITLRFVGNCDSPGTNEYNEKLGLRRAKAVCKYVDGKLGGGKIVHVIVECEFR